MTNGNGAPLENAAPPQLNILAQYIKDLSFENPNAPGSLQQQTQPQIAISVNVSANPMSDTDIEVTLRLEGKAEAAGTVMFNIELEFAGVCRIQNVPPEQVQPLVGSIAPLPSAIDAQRMLPRVRPEQRDPNDPSTWGKVARNESCPCGSGKKYKHCHGAVEEVA